MSKGRIARREKQVVVYKTCSICNGRLKPILVMKKGKKKHCFECNCGIFDKQGNKVL